MDVMQFTLFFLALLVGYVLLHLRLVRFEEHLQKLSGIRSIDDRLRGIEERLQTLGESFDKVGLSRIEQRLDRLHEDLEDLHEATGQVRHAVVQIPSRPPLAGADHPVGAAETMAVSAGVRIAGLVENRLLQLGYGNLQILTDLSGAEADRDIEVQVECERGGMPAKGRVLVRNLNVRDVAIQTVAQMFP
jgi:hypothetical protein